MSASRAKLYQNDPQCVRLARTLMQEIHSGKYRGGEKLESIRTLAERYKVGRQVVLSAFELLAKQDLCSKIHHGNACNLADVRNSSGGSGVDLNNVNLVVVYNVLDVYKTDNVQSLCQLLGVVDDNTLDMLGEVLTGVDAGSAPLMRMSATISAVSTPRFA